MSLHDAWQCPKDRWLWSPKIISHAVLWDPCILQERLINSYLLYKLHLCGIEIFIGDKLFKRRQHYFPWAFEKCPYDSLHRDSSNKHPWYSKTPQYIEMMDHRHCTSAISGHYTLQRLSKAEMWIFSKMKAFYVGLYYIPHSSLSNVASLDLRYKVCPLKHHD